MATELNEAALKTARTVESELWAQVPKNIPYSGEAGIQAIQRHLSELLPEESLPPIIEGYLRRITAVDPDTGRAVGTTTGEMQKVRSRALQLARDAMNGANPDSNMARIYGDVAEPCRSPKN